MKIIFLDVDGPMLPTRAYFLRANRSNNPYERQQFDPCAVAMVNVLLKASGAKLVISSTWAVNHQLGGKEKFSKVMVANGLNPADLHDDWMTPRKFSSSRGLEIRWWLAEHPETTHWAALDDDPSIRRMSGAVFCTMDDGLQMEHFQKARHLLGLPDQGLFIVEAVNADAP